MLIKIKTKYVYEYYDFPTVFLGSFTIDNVEKTAIFMWTDDEENTDIPFYVGVDFDEIDIYKFENKLNDLYSLLENKKNCYFAEWNKEGLFIYKINDSLLDDYMPIEGYYYDGHWFL